jgi:hypothetical protein
MKTCCRFLIAGAALIFALMPGSAVRSGGPQAAKKFQLPDNAFEELIAEANKNIQEELAPQNPSVPWPDRLRANALMIALATQHRMAHKQGDIRQLATMRDATIRIARAIDLDGTRNDLDTVRKQAGLLSDYPKLKADPNAATYIVRLKGIFDQEDVDFHFARKRTNLGIERELFALLRAKKPLAAEQITFKHEMLGYKIALLAEMLRDFDDHIPPQRVVQRKEWVSHATDVQYTGWELAEVFRAKNAEGVKGVVTRLNEACNKCHEKFRW